MLKVRRLREFIDELIEIRNAELKEKAQWEYWLHKDYERSYSDFKDALRTEDVDNEDASNEELINIVAISAEIASFTPQEG